jgi:hypothetical protein
VRLRDQRTNVEMKPGMAILQRLLVVTPEETLVV